MFNDTLAFQNKASIFKYLAENHMYSDLPSYREMQIQVAKFGKMTIAFHRKFPVELILSVPKKKFDKMRGIERHKLNQQSKVVDRLFMKMIEEMMVAALSGPDGLKKVTKGQLRRAAQKYIHRLNSSIHKTHQKALKEAYAAVAEELGGSTKA
jgi:hypothetical protein